MRREQHGNVNQHHCRVNTIDVSVTTPPAYRLVINSSKRAPLLMAADRLTQWRSQWRNVFYRGAVKMLVHLRKWRRGVKPYRK